MAQLLKRLMIQRLAAPLIRRGVGMLAAVLLLLSGAKEADAQINRYLTNGNQLYEQQKYKEAAANYEKALARDPNNATGLFNLGNSYYQQKQYDSSRKIMEATAKMSKDKNGQAAANYNIGNSYMAQQKWEDAVRAYKETLRKNPQDADAKYNLSYAEAMMKKQQQDKKDNKDNKDKQDKQNKDQKDKDKQKQDNKDQDKDKKDKDQQQDNKDQKDKQDKDQQEPQGQPSKLSQQQADQLLNALQQEEKKLQDKMKKEKGVPVKMQKDW
jgi:tetratricopeptide (TPR) repeat protein